MFFLAEGSESEQPNPRIGEGSVAGSSHMHYVSFRDLVKFAEFGAFETDQNWSKLM